MFWKIQEFLYVMGTEIFQFGPGKAEKNKIENFLLQIQNHDQSHLLSDQIVTQKLGFVLEGPSTFTFE